MANEYCIPTSGADFTFRIILVGECGVGKTTFVKSVRLHKYEEAYLPTFGVEVHPVFLRTTKGTIRFNLWDISGDEFSSKMLEGFYLGSHGALIFCDHRDTSRAKIGEWEDSVRKTLPLAPIGMVNTKSDLGFPMERALNISSKTEENIYEPLLEMARLLLHDFSIEMAE